MPDTLTTLSKIRKRLRASSEALAAQVDENPDDPHALKHLRLAADCANLELDIDLLTKLLLEEEEPDGTC